MSRVYGKADTQDPLARLTAELQEGARSVVADALARTGGNTVVAEEARQAFIRSSASKLEAVTAQAEAQRESPAVRDAKAELHVQCRALRERREGRGCGGYGRTHKLGEADRPEDVQALRGK